MKSEIAESAHERLYPRSFRNRRVLSDHFSLLWIADRECCSGSCPSLETRCAAPCAVRQRWCSSGGDVGTVVFACRPLDWERSRLDGGHVWLAHFLEGNGDGGPPVRRLAGRGCSFRCGAESSPC